MLSLDDVIYNIPDASFPFAFTFNGNSYTGCNVSTNGFITFGTTPPAADYYSPISGTTAYAGAVSAWGKEINSLYNISGETGEIRWETVGAAPDREVVIQWKNFRPSYSTSTTQAYSQNFQIRLQENGNKVVIVYGNGSYLIGSGSISGTAQVGLRGASNTDYHNRSNSTGVSFNLSAAGATNGATQAYNTVNTPPGMPASGLTYTYAPPATCTGTPTAGITQSTVQDSVCDNTNFTLSLPGATLASGLAYQWISSADGVSYSNASGTTSSFTTNLSAETYYRCIVTCLTSGLSDTSTVLFLKLKSLLNCYCQPSANNCTEDDVIFNVTVNNINNTSGCSPNGYELYSSTVDTFYQGEDYTISVTVGEGGTEYVGLWIDYNQNGTFETSEYQNIGSGFGSTIFNTITIPANAATGNTMMRLRVRWGTALTGSDACATYNYGETEDYSIYIQVPPPCTTPTVGGTISGVSLGAANASEIFVLNGFTGKPAWEISLNPAGPFTALHIANDSLPLFLNAVGTFYLRAKVSTPGCTVSYSDTFALTIYQPGDEPCDAIAINFGKNGPYTMEFATASAREVRPLGGDCESQNTWCNRELTNSLWFKFTAPVSGRVKLYAPSFDARLALWEADTCANLADSTLGNYKLLAANDDDPDATANGVYIFSPLIDTVNCLVPGKTYYVQLAPYIEDDYDTTSLFLMDAGLADASFTGFNGDVYCELASNETLTPVVGGGVFTGAGIENDNEFNPALAGIGEHIITHTLLGCYTFTDTVSVTGNPVVDSIAQTNVACFGDSSGALTVYFSNGSQPFSYQWNDGKTTQTITGLVAGTYNVTVISNDGCPGFSPVYTVTQAASAITASSVATPQSGATNGSITVTVSGGTPNYTYVWDNNETTKDIAAVAGVYTLTVTDANSCTFVLKDTIDFISSIGNTINGIRKVSLYPNPTSGIATLSIETDAEQNVLVEVYDAAGRLLSSLNKTSVQTENISLNLNEYSAGVYTVRVRLNDVVMTKQIVLQR